MNAVEMTRAENFGEIDARVALLNFERLKWKLSHSVEAAMIAEECEFAEREYRRFLSLKRFYPDANLVPSHLLDKFWHAHILDTRAYMRDCEFLFGGYLHHSPFFGEYGEESQEELNAGFEKTKMLYEKHFGTYPESADIGRCHDKPCHAPTPCRCR